MAVLRILINILNAGIDYDMKRGATADAKKKIEARDRILTQLINSF